MTVVSPTFLLLNNRPFQATQNSSADNSRPPKKRVSDTIYPDDCFFLKDSGGRI